MAKRQKTRPESVAMLDGLSVWGKAVQHDLAKEYITFHEAWRWLSYEDKQLLDKAYAQSQKEFRDFQEQQMEWYRNSKRWASRKVRE